MLADALTTRAALRRGHGESNPLLGAEPVHRLTWPFLLAAPAVFALGAAEHRLFAGVDPSALGALRPHSDDPVARGVALGVFACLTLSMQKLYASCSNLCVVAVGIGLPDVMSWLTGVRRPVPRHALTVLVGAIASLPFVYVARRGFDAVLVGTRAGIAG